MHDQWKPIYSALATDIMDQLGHRDQAMTPDIRPCRPDAQIAGPALTLDAYANPDPHPDPDPASRIVYGHLLRRFQSHRSAPHTHRCQRRL